MKELIRQQGQCLTYAKDAANSLSKFFDKKSDEGLFYVSFSHEKGFGKAKLEPNAATSIICGVFASLDSERGKALCESDVWLALDEQVKKAAKYVAKSPLNDALPLKTMGKLPLHSIAHLTQLLLYGDAAKIEVATPIIESELLAICIRRLIVAIELDLKADNHNSRERLHPYHIYGATHALSELIELNKRDKKKEDKRLYNCLDVFKAQMERCEEALLNAIIIKYELGGANASEEAKSDLEFGGNEWPTISGAISTEYFEQLFSRIEERAVVQAQAQIANKASSVSPDFDPSSLTFAIATLSELRTERYRHIVHQGLDLLLRVFEEDEFASTIPFMVDDKGRAAFVPSVETANALLKVCEEQLKESRAAELERAADVALRFQRRLEGTKQSATNGITITGWCSDKAPSKGRVDSWVTAYALEFFYRSHEIVKLEKRRTIFEDYSWTSYDKCKPKWHEIIDPDFDPSGADDSKKEPTKHLIMSLIDSLDKDRRAPVFLLYGPPGTSKTSFVKGVAQHKKWDLISLSPSDFISESIDKVEHRARKIFHDLMNIDECVVLFDEMDSLLQDRDGKEGKDGVLKFVVPAFLPKLQDLHDHVAKSQMAVFFVTNYAERIDNAIKRKGRIDERLLIPPYNEEARKQLLNTLIIKKFGKSLFEHADTTPEITKALKMMSSMSVYREVAEFVHCFKPEGTKLGLMIEDAKSIYSDGLSIPPNTYEKEKRQDAYEEFIKIIKRIAGDGVSDWKTWEKAKSDAQKQFNCDKDFDKWNGIVESWLRPAK